MRFRWLGNVCIEIMGQQHLLADPNFVLTPQPALDLILVTHEHADYFRDEAKGLGAPIWALKSAAPIHYDPQEKTAIAQQLVDKIQAQGVEAAILTLGEWVEAPAE